MSQRIPENLPVPAPDVFTRHLDSQIRHARRNVRTDIGLASLNGLFLACNGVPAVVGLVTKHPEWIPTVYTTLDAILVPLLTWLARKSSQEMHTYQQALNGYQRSLQVEQFLQLPSSEQQKLIEEENNHIAGYTLYKFLKIPNVAHSEEVTSAITKNNLLFIPESKAEEDKLKLPITAFDALITCDVLKNIEGNGTLNASELEAIKEVQQELQHRIPDPQQLLNW